MTGICVIAERVVAASGVVSPGWVEVAGSTIVDIGSGRPPQSLMASTELSRGPILMPGYVDLHMHGGGGFDVTWSAADIIGALAFHRTHGTTSSLVSLVSAPIDRLCAQLGRVADVIESGRAPGLLGAHLEGPFLSAHRCGAQDPRHAIAPDRTALRQLLAAGRGHVRVVTLAPELPGALDLVDYLVAAGVVVAVGHTDASYEQTQAAFAHGASLVTHLFNAMRPIHHRDPGPVVAALEAGVPCEVINDGVHTHPFVTRLVGPDRLVLITDAISAAGAPDGDYRLGDQLVRVADGQARLEAGGTLAGSTLTMGDAVRRLMLSGDLGYGTSGLSAVAAASSGRAAAVLGMAARQGGIDVGLEADLVLLDSDQRPARVMQAGRWTDLPVVPA